MSNSKFSSATAIRGAVAAGAATAVLLGGYGVFALWSDSATAGATGDIQTGSLVLNVDSSSASWQLENPQGGGAPVAIADIATYVASPGDELSYTGLVVDGSVTGSDITAELVVDTAAIRIAPELAGDVDVTVDASALGASNPITGTQAGTSFSGPVSVTVTFADSISDPATMNLLQAVQLSSMDIQLAQK